MGNIGNVLYHQEKYDEALEIQQRALEILEQQRDENNPDIAKYYKQLGSYFIIEVYLFLQIILILFSASFCTNSRIW